MMTRIKMRRRLISISLRTRNSLSDFVGGLLYVVTKRRQRQRRRIDCKVYSHSATSRTPLSIGASFFLLACSLPGGPRCREVNLSLRGSPCTAFHYIVKVPTPDFCEEDPHRGSSLWNPLLGSSRYEGPRCQGGNKRPEVGLGGSRRGGHTHGHSETVRKCPCLRPCQRPFGDKPRNGSERPCIRLAPAPYRDGPSQKARNPLH